MWKRRRTILLCVGLALAGLISFHSIADDANPPTPVRSSRGDTETGTAFMHSKLRATHQIVDGLAFEDFAVIEKGASALIHVGEMASSNVRRNPVYMQYAADFENTAVQLRDAARARSIEKATFAYMHLTVSCAACHRHVRNVVQIAPGREAKFTPVRPRTIR